MDYEPIPLSLSDWEVLLQVWDVSDNTAYQLPIKSIVESSSAVVIVYDVTSEINLCQINSLSSSLMSGWLESEK